MARRSTRLSSRASTPKRVSLSHDPPKQTRTPKTVPAKLASLDESDEMPGAFPQSASPSARPSKMSKTDAQTPTRTTPIKPTQEEMHPQLHHQTTAKPRDEARHLGFSNMAPHTEPPKHSSKTAALQGTPSRTRDLESDVKSPDFQFTFQRERSLELSPEAKQLMYEKREEAARIREQMIADGEGMPSIDELLSARKIAKPRGRFSQVHMKEFEKMDSIAAHPSTLRLKQSVTTPGKQAQKDDAAAKSLKRSPSKAGLDQPSSTPSQPSSRDTNKPLPAAPASQLLRSTSIKDLKKAAAAGASSPSKRVKRTDNEDVSATRPPSSDDEKPLPATPGRQQSGNPGLSHLTTPTQASLARAASVKSTKTKIPAPASFTPAKPAPASILKRPTQQNQHVGSPALLHRSPSKASLFPKKPDAAHTANSGAAAPESPLLSRSPSKRALTMKATDVKKDDEVLPTKAAPLLSRSPVKGPAAKKAEAESTEEQGKASAVPFLSRSPSKLPANTAPTEPQDTPSSKSTGKNLLGRFNLLRQSPMKSILRSPQRLYSDDPAKVAAGTHLATPPKLTANTNKSLPSVPRSATASAQKHVDFTSSTKARFDKAHSSTPSKTPTPSPKPDRDVDMADGQGTVSYPDLSNNDAVASPSPQKRRQTGGPGDFTFRAGDGIIFGQSPNAPASAASSKRPSTIRMVSSDLAAAPAPPPAPAFGSKKRKFEFENKTAAAAEDVDGVEEKENTPVIEEASEEEQRPAKRTKQSALAPAPRAKKPSAATAPTASSTRRTTLGVKPKGAKSTSPVKRPSTISQARLAALSQPKRR